MDINELTHRGLDKITNILQTIFVNAVHSMKSKVFGLKFYWNLFPNNNNYLNVYPDPRRDMVSLSFSELNM